MRKLVIANRGVGGIGKSSAIKAVWQLLKDKGYKPDVEVWQRGDIMAVFDINNVKIGISSQGDPGSCMKENMELFEDKFECGIIVTSCRMKGDTYHKVTDYLGEKKHYAEGMLEALSALNDGITLIQGSSSTRKRVTQFDENKFGSQSELREKAISNPIKHIGIEFIEALENYYSNIENQNAKDSVG